MDLIRELLLAIEALPPRGVSTPGVAVDGYDDATIAYHLVLLEEAGLIHAAVADASDLAYPDVFVHRLTWHGHEFLDAARSQTVWAKAKAIVREKGGDIPFAILRELLLVIGRQSFGVT
jgi:hypothetical protein